MRRTDPKEREIEEMIAGYDGMMRDLAEREALLMREYQAMHEKIYEYLVWEPGTQPAAGCVSAGSRLPGVVQEKTRMESGYREELLAAAAKIRRRREKLMRQHLAYLMLPGPEREVLKKLYEEGCPWKNLRSELPFSRQKLLALRKQGIKTICEAGEDSRPFTGRGIDDHRFFAENGRI